MIDGFSLGILIFLGVWTVFLILFGGTMGIIICRFLNKLLKETK